MVLSPDKQFNELLKKLTDHWLIEKNQAALWNILSDKSTWICDKRDKVLKGKEEIAQYIKDNRYIVQESCSVCSLTYEVLEATEEFAITTIDIQVAYSGYLNEQKVSPLRFTIIWRKENSIWNIVHMHSSALDIELMKQGDNESLTPINERLKIASRTDSITNIANMEGFCEDVQKLLKKKENRYVLIKFGIKDFRYINQRHGYGMGDIVLQNIGKNLNISCSEIECCGRIEKDTFAMLYQYKGKQNISNRMEAVRIKLIDKELLYKLGMEIDFIAGIYIIPKTKKEHVKVMLDKALMAQQRVSRYQSGSHYLYYEEGMMKKQYLNNQIISYAPSALENGEFQLYIQPQFEITTCKVIAGEALCRWEREKGVFIPPNDFIPLFEDYGLILDFDFYMLEKLCQKMQEWILGGSIIKPISINQSRLHIENKDYIKKFCKVVDRYAIPHHYIAFELTESAFVEQYEKMIALAAELHKQGFQLAIDDFGTGFASLNLLSVVSADILKVDKSLLDSIHSKRGRTVLQKVIELAHQMEMTVVCEGIEQMEQLKQLKEMNCDLGQGFLVGKPIPASVFEKIWIKRVEEEKWKR